MTDPPAADLNQLIKAALRYLDDNVVDDADDPALPLVGWKAVAELQYNRPDATTLAAAIDLCRSADDRHRRLGTAILGQFGHSSANPHGVFREERHVALEQTLRAEIATTANPGVLSSVCFAFGHLQDCRAIPIVLELIEHPVTDVRAAVIMALTGHEDDAAISGLIRLSSDKDGDVRDWATFALGQQIDADTAPIRSALHARLEDVEAAVRNEAIEGLARRHDRTVIPALVRELEKQVAEPLLSAARELADPSLCPALVNAGRIISQSRKHGERLADYWEACWLEAVSACDCRLNVSGKSGHIRDSLSDAAPHASIPGALSGTSRQAAAGHLLLATHPTRSISPPNSSIPPPALVMPALALVASWLPNADGGQSPPRRGFCTTPRARNLNAAVTVGMGHAIPAADTAVRNR